jgi:23S rRNA pseudouridine1911/1915/1917 synthase
MRFQHPCTGEEVFLHREPEGRAFDLMDAEEEDW